VGKSKKKSILIFIARKKQICPFFGEYRAGMMLIHVKDDRKVVPVTTGLTFPEMEPGYEKYSTRIPLKNEFPEKLTGQNHKLVTLLYPDDTPAVI